jgi:hypothetical protein
MSVILLVFLLLIFGARQVSAVEPAGTVVFADDFSNSLSKWQIARGNSNMWTVENGVLQGEVLSPSTVTELVPLPTLWSDDWRHYELEWDMKALAGSDRNIAWGYQDQQNWYEIHFLPSFFEFARFKNHSVAWSKSGTGQFILGTWQHFKMRTVGGNLQLFMNNVQVFEYEDAAYEGNRGTIALRVGTGATTPTRVQFDNVTVRLLPDPGDVVLPVPGFRQDDRVWGDATYDSALSWAGTEPATIARWGCALTSATMVLRYHGFTQLLDGAPLTPLSLNSWLLSQPDGYVVDGWVNWIALVRLVRLLRVEWSTSENPLPQLRYSYQGWSDWETEGRSLIAAEIAAGIPAILELPQHFVVANAVVASGDTLILDPASDKTMLSQGFSNPTSARLWQKQTGNEALNLSYWLVIFPRGFRVKLLTADGETITNWWLSQDLPGSNSENFFPAKWLALTVPEPPEEVDLKIEIAPATGDVSLDGGIFPFDEAYIPYQPYTLQLYRYDAEANVTQQIAQGNMGTHPQTWEFTASKVHQKLDWESMLQELNQLDQRGLISPVVAGRLKHIAQFALISSESASQRYLTWLNNLYQQILSFNTSLIHDDARNYLQTWIQIHFRIPSGD